MPNNHASLTAQEILTETRRMIDSKRWRSTATALNAYREFIDTAMPRMMDIVEQQREQIAALEKERDGLAQNNLDCREVLVTLFINEGNTEEIARLSVQEVLGEASCQK